MTDRRDDRRRLDGRSNHDAAVQVAHLVALLEHAIDRGLRFLQHATFADLLHDADDRVPMAVSAETEPSAQRRLAGEVAIRKRLVDDRHRRIGLLIRRAEESALAQTRADGCKVVAAHVANERDLVGKTVRRLAVQPIESRVGEVGERDEVDRSGADDAGNRTHLLQLRVDECHAPVEVLVSEQRSLERQ